jgi:undecaprenyl-diphosphatase
LDLLQAFVLGLVQGLTEFLPISSSAHLIIVPWLFGWKDPAINSIQFDVALHMGTLIAVIAYFWSDWRRLVGAFIGSIIERSVGEDPNRRMAWYVLLASIPAAVVGAVGESKIDEFFHRPDNLRIGLLVIATMMIVMAAVLLLAERVGSHRLDLSGIDLRKALGIGFAQALSLIPGVSRSGSTITAGLFFGLQRAAAARFSFLLATPVVLGAGLKKLYDLLKEPGFIPEAERLGFAIGFVTAGVTGFLCIHFLLRYLQHRSTAPFIWYRFMAGIALILLVVFGVRS